MALLNIVCLHRRRLMPFFLALALCVWSAAGAARAESACAGSDIVSELAASEPDAHARLLDAARDTLNGEAMLWRITRQGLTPSYLFGTAHMTDPRLTTLSEATREAIDASRVVALEVADVSPTAMAEAIATTPSLMLFTDGRRLDLLLSPEAFGQVVEELDKARLPSDLARYFQPWVVSMVMAVSACERARLESGKKVLDMVVAERAAAKDIPVVGLETIEDQLAASASVPMDEQVALLKAALSMADRADDLRETILQLYLKRQLGAALPLQQLIAERSGARGQTFRGFKAKLVEERNRRMRTHMLPLIAGGGAFIAVGGLHLPGESGLVALLRNVGYEVVPVE